MNERTLNTLRETDRQADRQTDSQTARQPDRQTDRQTDRQRQTERESEREMLKDDNSHVFNFKQHLLFAHSSNHRCNSGTQVSAGTLRTIHEHIVDVVTARCFAHTTCVLMYLSLAFTTSS